VINEEVKQDISDIIIKTLGHKDWEIEDDFTNDLGFDSLDMYNFYMDVESHFKVSINEYDMEGMTKPLDVMIFVESRLKYV
jgi:acyl carrier protein